MPAKGGAAVDMSPAAIARRLARLDELFRLGLSLSRARRVGPVEPGRAGSLSDPGQRDNSRTP
jgi:hypothetical protein